MHSKERQTSTLPIVALLSGSCHVTSSGDLTRLPGSDRELLRSLGADQGTEFHLGHYGLVATMLAGPLCSRMEYLRALHQSKAKLRAPHCTPPRPAGVAACGVASISIMPLSSS